MENYEQKYKELIERFDVLLNLDTVKESGTLSVDDIRKSIPELSESCDESIRKELIDMLKECEDGQQHFYDIKDIKKWISWLETQGKQKPNKCMYSKDNYTDEDREVLCDGCEEDCKIKQKSIEMITPEESLGISSDEYNKIVNECIFGEQKPEWSEEDEKMLNLIIARLHSHPNVELEEYGKSYDWLNSLRPQPKQEWSKEDEKERMHIIGLLEGWMNTFKETCYAEDCKCGIVWLKSLKDRVGCEVNCTTTKEWREEDETVLNNLIYALANDRIGNNRDEYVDWLQSLRHRKQWKPNGDQIDALYDMMRSFKKESSYSNRDDIANIAETLLEQLKAL